MHPARSSARALAVSRSLYPTTRINELLIRQPNATEADRQPRFQEKTTRTVVRRDRTSTQRRDDENTIKRNELGVQMLSRKLHAQIFHGSTGAPPDRRLVRLAREHLNTHGLDIAQGSTVPNTNITLPPLQGRSIDEHFFRIGAAAAEPWLRLAKLFTVATPPPRPEYWHIQPGWTKYHFCADGTSYSESVASPDEVMLSFDVETLPNHHNFAVMACAMSQTHWYSWISPWLLGQTDDPEHLIPLGPAQTARIVVGHNVSYDRARLREEYHVSGTRTRFLDTMSLHVAVKGISSHQRPAWAKYRKSKAEAQERQEEAVEVARDLLRETEESYEMESDAAKRAELKRRAKEIEESLPLMEDDVAEAEATSKRWEDITSANSLADVAKLHCGIDISKYIRDDFMTHTREEIAENMQDYLDYCASDVAVTHSVFARVFPDFLQACPSPVSFAGVLTMGSSFLTVNQEWEHYLENAERTYRELEEGIKKRLITLAEEAKGMVDGERWRADVWLAQLDWTPKVPRKSRGVEEPPKPKTSKRKPTKNTDSDPKSEPKWSRDLVKYGTFSANMLSRTLPLLLRLSYRGHPLQFSPEEGWTCVDKKRNVSRPTNSSSNKRIMLLLGKSMLKEIESGRLTSTDNELVIAIANGDRSRRVSQGVTKLVEKALDLSPKARSKDPWLSQLDWSYINADSKVDDEQGTEQAYTPITWPKWYWELTAPKKDATPGSINLTVRSRLAPLLLRLSWLGWPLFHSREHGWIYRVPKSADTEGRTRQKPLNFFDPADKLLQDSALDGHAFYKLPHKDGESANVGSPLAKTFMKYAQDGTLTSPGGEAKSALEMNAMCSYWISARDRILKQNVVWDGKTTDMGLVAPAGPTTGMAHDRDEKWGIIIPQVITMGTVTRRAIERTWLTASNAKVNRVGSELKAMVRAPRGYAIVGADVDSEELWISSALGDAQFGMHGATALGWMTLEGTKAAGTDLHSKTASILGISRDAAKVFNYSRIYGAGVRHAQLLLLQGNPSMSPEDAMQQAEKLYVSTKGRNTHRNDMFGRKFWFGGTESFVFNKLEEIAVSDRPQTPALDCGITHALSKEYLPPGVGGDYMTSRINWVVQSSGVDYLHLLIVAMDYLIAKYDIKARYLISVHDELRYLVKNEDRYRTALALQIANLWTRCLFAYRLGMDDLPQGVAFFSAVDVDTVLRKEVDLPCVTPSQPNPIPPGESLNIVEIVEKTHGGSLWPNGKPMQPADSVPQESYPDGYIPPDCMVHRAKSAYFLRAQATSEFAEVKRLASLESGKTFTGGIGGPGRGRRPKLLSVQEL